MSADKLHYSQIVIGLLIGFQTLPIPSLLPKDPITNVSSTAWLARIRRHKWSGHPRVRVQAMMPPFLRNLSPDLVDGPYGFGRCRCDSPYPANTTLIDNNSPSPEVRAATGSAEWRRSLAVEGIGHHCTSTRRIMHR